MNRTNWKLIKTAPKDGTEIIGVHISEWGDRQKTLYGPWTVAFRSGRWQSSWDGVQVIDYMSDFGTDYKTPDLEPTHWIPLPEVVNTDPEVSSRTETAGWQPIESAVADHVVLVCNPDEGTLPVVAMKVEDTWYQHDLRGTALTPAPKFWMRWPKMPRSTEAVAETDADAQRDDGLLSGVSADPTPT